MSKAILLIDGHYFLFRSYAVPFKFYSKRGKVPLHVVTTYLKLLRRSIAIVEQTHDLIGISVIFDSQTKNVNHEISSVYKGNRKFDYSGELDSPFHHYPLIKKVLNYLEIFHNELEGVEADDYIASLTERFKKKFKVFIASSDSDFYQLLGDQVNQIILKRKDNYEVLNHLSVQDKLGIPPSEYVFWKSLVGDRADNIQGIKGIGSKRATKIVNGLIDFDDGSYQEVIDKNEKLISLDRSTIQEVNMVDLNYSRKRTFTSNSLIFEAAGLG